MIQENDALGGGGSLRTDLRAIAVGGLSRTIDGFLSKKFPLTSFNERGATAASGETTPASAPAPALPTIDRIKGLLQDPVVIGVVISVVASMLIFAVLRR